jgi:hypothetical protein
METIAADPFIRLKVPPWSTKKLKKEKHNTLNDVVLTNSYILGFFFLLFGICQFSIWSLVFYFRSILPLISLSFFFF